MPSSCAGSGPRLVLRPPSFWVGVAVAGGLLLGLAALLLRFALRWLFALPILLEDPAVSPRAALAASAARTRGRTGRHLVALAVWGLATFATTAALQALVAALGERLLDAVGPRLVVALPATAAVLALATATAVVAGWSATACLAALVDRLHHEATGRAPSSAAPPPPRALVRRSLVVLGAVVAGTTLAATALLVRSRPRDVVEVTAHRMGAFAAPENTLAALAHAIADGADWAELDVQLTSDGHLVVLHDFDLVRVGGPRRRVAASTFAEVRAIDVGRGLRHAGFEGERVPTLDEVIAAAGDRIRLNVELKPPDAAAVAPLTDAVVAALRRAGLVGRCRVCSQSYAALRRAKAAEPGLEVGFIAGAAVGDLAALDVAFVMVNAGLVTPAFVRRAHAAGLEVHPWTVNDPDAAPRLVDAGVDNVITDAPREVRARVDEVLGLSLAERLLLRVRGRLTDGR
jgi:glycerophosphoryl diester phosphodiesterase